MRRFILALLGAWLAAAVPLVALGAQPTKVAAVLAQRDPYPGAALALDFVGAASGGQQFYKAKSVNCGQALSCVPGLTVSRAASAYAENLDGSLTLFGANQARVTNKGLLIEEARTNLALQSQNFTGWTSSATALSADTATAPDGTQTGDTLTAAAGSTNHERYLTGSISANTNYAFSVYAKAGTSRYLFLTLAGSAGHYAVGVFDLLACGSAATQTGVGGTSGAIASTGSAAAANGWCRVFMVAQINATSGFWAIGLASAATGNTLNTTGEVTFAAAGTEGASLWQADLQAGSFITSGIPTTSATATRPADVINISGLSFSDFSSMLAEAQYTGYLTSPSSQGTIATLFKDANNYIYAGRHNTGVAVTGQQVQSGAASQADLDVIANPQLNVIYSVASRWATNDFASSVGGAPPITDTSGTVPTGAASLGLGNYASTIQQLNGFLRRLVLYRQALSSGQLQALSAGNDLTSLDLNFAAGTYKVTPAGARSTNFAALPGVTVTRASSGYAEDVAGNLTSFSNNVARITNKGLLVEEARTNQVLQSQNPASASYTKAGLTGSSNTVVAPDGTTTGGTITASAGSGDHYFGQGLTNGGATTYTISAYVKPGTTNYAWLSLENIPNNYVSAVFDVSACALGQTVVGSASGTLLGTSATKVANGWCRISLSGSMTPANNNAFYGPAPAATGNTFGTQGLLTWTAAGTETINVWGMQFEAGPFPTSYIVTTTATATRPADAISLSYTPAAPYSVGLQMLNPATLVNTKTYTPLTIDTDSSNMVQPRFNNGGASPLVWSALSGGAAQVSSSGIAATPTAGALSYTALRIAAGSYGSSYGGAAVTTSAGALVPATNTVWIGSDISGGTPLNSYVQRVTLYPYSANDNELQYRSAGNW